MEPGHVKANALQGSQSKWLPCPSRYLSSTPAQTLSKLAYLPFSSASIIGFIASSASDPL